MRVDEDNYGILRRAEDILGTDYGLNITNDDDITGFIDSDNLTQMIDDLCMEIDRLKESLDDLKDYYEEQIRECYKPISPYEMYGVSEHDFY